MTGLRRVRRLVLRRLAVDWCGRLIFGADLWGRWTQLRHRWPAIAGVLHGHTVLYNAQLGCVDIAGHGPIVMHSCRFRPANTLNPLPTAGTLTWVRPSRESREL